MVEPNSQIDVEELMERVRAEVAQRRRLSDRQSNGSSTITPKLPPIRFRTTSPPAVGAHDLEMRAERLATLHDLLERARQATDVNKKIPVPFRWLFRKQGRYNSLLIQSVIPLFETVSRLLQWREILVNNFQAQTTWLDDSARNLRSLQTGINAALQQLNELQQKVEDTNKLATRTEERQSSDAVLLKGEVHLLNRRLSETQPSTKQHATSADNTRPTVDHKLDALYLAFEEQFRGSRDLIKRRVEIYVQEVVDLGLGTSDAPIVDLGCGRGEWLEIVTERGLVAEGVDLNRMMLSTCREHGFHVIEADALEFLRGLPSNSRGVVTGFHLIEHLEFHVLMELLRESCRVLRPGGLVVFETPNPENVVVGSNRFYLDPTHHHPLPKELTRFLLESAGFSHVVIRPLNRDDYVLPENSATPELRELLNRLLFGEQDYAVLGRKPGA